MKQLLTKMVKRLNDPQAFQASLLSVTGYTLPELQDSYNRIVEFIEGRRKAPAP